MKIAVTYENGEIFQHFGHTKEFKVYDVEDGRIAASRVVGTDGQGHGALADLLSELGVEVLICGGIGGGAQMALASLDIKLFGGVHGSADGAVEAFISRSLSYDPDAKCSHHDHGEGHGCGHHHGDGDGHSCGHHHGDGEGHGCGHHHGDGEGHSCGHHHDHGDGHGCGHHHDHGEGHGCGHHHDHGEGHGCGHGGCSDH